MSDKNFPFKISIKSTPDLINIETFLPGVIYKFFIKDSVFDYFPYAHLSILDNAGLFTEERFFTEGLDMTVKLSDLKEKEVIEHKLYLSEYQMNNPINPNYITGVTDYYLKSDFKKQDEVVNKAHYGNINSIVRRIMASYSYPGSVPVMKISETANQDIWYQVNEYDYQFITKLAKYSYSPSNQDSPFLTFINSKGEFIFQDIKTLLNQNPVAELYYGVHEEKGITPEYRHLRNDVVQSFTFQALGSPINMENYKIEFYKNGSDGKSSKKEVLLDDKISSNKIGQNKLTIRKQYLSNVRSQKYYGITDNQSQDQAFKGWMNSNYIDTLSFSYRMRVTTLFNPKIYAGKVVSLNFKSPFVNKDYKASEYNGMWFVIESIHSIDDNGVAITALILGKNSLDVSKKHKFYADFI